MALLIVVGPLLRRALGSVAGACRLRAGYRTITACGMADLVPVAVQPAALSPPVSRMFACSGAMGELLQVRQVGPETGDAHRALLYYAK